MSLILLLFDPSDILSDLDLDEAVICFFTGM